MYVEKILGCLLIGKLNGLRRNFPSKSGFQDAGHRRKSEWAVKEKHWRFQSTCPRKIVIGRSVNLALTLTSNPKPCTLNLQEESPRLPVRIRQQLESSSMTELASFSIRASAWLDNHHKLDLGSAELEILHGMVRKFRV